MSSLSSIEKAALGLDEYRRSRVKEQAVDFDSYMKARDEDVGRIKGPTDFRDDLINEFHGDAELEGCVFPWPKTEDKFRLRRGEVTIWAGFNGHMKSMVSGYVSLALMAQGEKCCIASFEMKPRKTLRRLASQACGTGRPTEKYIDLFLDGLVDKLWLYDQQGETSPERVLGVVYYCAEQLGVTHFFIDSLMKVIAAEDDYNGQKRFIAALCTAAKDLNISIHLVHHSRKREDERSRPGKQDAKGTGAIVDQTDNFITVFKTPKKPEDGEEKPDFFLYVDKQRHGEWEGAIPLWFLDSCLQFHDRPNAHPRNWVKTPETDF